MAGCLRREPAIDFLSAHTARLDSLSDEEVLALAAIQARILVTHDFRTMPKHFGELLAGGRSSPGVFLIKQSTRVAEVIEELVLVWAASEPEDWTNRILQIPLR